MRTLRLLLSTLALGVVLASPGRAADQIKKVYDLPAGEASSALKRFAEVSGRETLFAADAIRGVRTAAIRGEFSPQEALNKMLANTGLSAAPDTTTGAFAVTKQGALEKNVASRPAAPSAAEPRSGVTDPRSRPSSVDFPEPFAPVIATRSPRSLPPWRSSSSRMPSRVKC